MQVVGESMVPYGFLPGDIIHPKQQSAHVGDIVVFSCHKSGCHGHYIKKLTQKRGACYWVEGRRDVWVDDTGQKKISIDSQTLFGWLCDDEIIIHGIIM